MTNKELYIHAINKIDDYFEYQNESTKDKKFVMSVINQLSDQLSIYSDNVVLYYVIRNDGAGGASLKFFHRLGDAEDYEENMGEGFGESTIDTIETIIGSETYNEAE